MGSNCAVADFVWKSVIHWLNYRHAGSGYIVSFRFRNTLAMWPLLYIVFALKALFPPKNKVLSLGELRHKFKNFEVKLIKTRKNSNGRELIAKTIQTMSPKVLTGFHYVALIGRGKQFEVLGIRSDTIDQHCVFKMLCQTCVTYSLA